MTKTYKLFKRPCGLCRRSGFLVSKLSLWVALGVISALNFYVFLSFGGRLAHLGSSLGPKGGSWRSFQRQACSRVVFGVPRERILMSKVAQETPRVASSHQKSAQRGPGDVPKGRKITKNPKLRHLDFERPYGVLATFAAFGGTGAGRNAAETRTLRNIAKKHAFGVALPRPKATLPPRGGWWGAAGKKTRPGGCAEGDPKVNPPPPTPYPGRATPAAPPLQSRAKAQCNAMQS